MDDVTERVRVIEGLTDADRVADADTDGEPVLLRVGDTGESRVVGVHVGVPEGDPEMDWLRVAVTDVEAEGVLVTLLVLVRVKLTLKDTVLEGEAVETRAMAAKPSQNVQNGRQNRCQQQAARIARTLGVDGQRFHSTFYASP